MSQLTLDNLKYLFHYNPTTGLFTRLVAYCNCIKIGDIAGSPDKDGYTVIKIKGKVYKAHRLAWFYHYGEWPKGEIDHINGVKSDNRLDNLRLSTRSGNLQNLKCALRNNYSTKLLGASACSNSDKFVARITVRGKVHNLGTYDTPQEAHEAYLEAKRRLHPYGTL